MGYPYARTFLSEITKTYYEFNGEDVIKFRLESL